MMNHNAKFYWSAAAVFLIIILGIIHILFRAGGVAPITDTASSTPEMATSTPQGGYTIEQEAIPSLADIEPNLDRGIQFSASVPDEVRTALLTQAKDITTQLKKDPTSAADWFNLAIVYHTANDYEGAKAVWEFLVKTVTPPGDAVALENLAKLYHFDLKDYAKAESYFEQAIAADPKNLSAYLELYQLYLYSYKQNTAAAADILETAAQKFPEDYTPYYTLGMYYKTKGDTADARGALEKAMDRARAAGDVDGMNRVGDALVTLPQ